jgi:class 3 adenylate cyclase
VDRNGRQVEPTLTRARTLQVSWADLRQPTGAKVAAIVARYGGRVVRVVDATLLAVFGVPHTRDDDAEQAVRVALKSRA